MAYFTVNPFTGQLDEIATVPPGTITGPGSSTIGDIVLWNDGTGTALSDSGVQISTDGTFAADSDTLVPTQKAVKTYVDAQSGGGGSSPSGPRVSNISLTYDTGVLTVTGESAPLSVSNPAVVVLPNAFVGGQFFEFQITADQSVSDGTALSQMDGAYFGLTGGVAVTTDIPFYLYAVYNIGGGSNTAQFAIARLPNLYIAGTAGCIGNTISITNNNSIFILNTVDPLEYVGSPCVCLGSFRMQKTGLAGVDDWTVQTLAYYREDGIGKYNESTEFTVPAGQTGTNASGYIFDDAGNGPVMSISLLYNINRLGVVTQTIGAGGVLTSPGAGGNPLLIYSLFPSTLGATGATSTPGFLASLVPPTGSATFASIYQVSQTIGFQNPDGTLITNGFFAAGLNNPSIQTTFTYTASTL